MSKPNKADLQRIVDLEKLRSRRRTLKRLLLGTGAIGTASAVNAQQSNASKVLPAVNALLLDDDNGCDVPQNSSADDPTAPQTPTGAEFVLNESSYTGTASRQFVVETEDSDCGHIVTATVSVCMDVTSSSETDAEVDMDIIVILEGLSAVDPIADEPSVEYYIRKHRDQTPFSELLIERSISINQPNEYRARTGLYHGSQKSCGFLPLHLDYSLRIENNRPIVGIKELNRDTPASTLNELSLGRLSAPAVKYTVPAMQVTLAPGSCNHPDRSNSTCNFKHSLRINDAPGTLTTPEPLGGPIL